MRNGTTIGFVVVIFLYGLIYFGDIRRVDEVNIALEKEQRRQFHEIMEKGNLRRHAPGFYDNTPESNSNNDKAEQKVAIDSRSLQTSGNTLSNKDNIKNELENKDKTSIDHVTANNNGQTKKENARVSNPFAKNIDNNVEKNTKDEIDNIFSRNENENENENLNINIDEIDTAPHGLKGAKFVDIGRNHDKNGINFDNHVKNMDDDHLDDLDKIIDHFEKADHLAPPPLHSGQDSVNDNDDDDGNGDGSGNMNTNINPDPTANGNGDGGGGGNDNDNNDNDGNNNNESKHDDKETKQIKYEYLMQDVDPDSGSDSATGDEDEQPKTTVTTDRVITTTTTTTTLPPIPERVPRIVNVFNWSLYDKIKNDHFLKRKYKIDSSNIETLPDKHKPFMDKYFPIDYYKNIDRPIKYIIPQPYNNNNETLKTNKNFSSIFSKHINSFEENNDNDDDNDFAIFKMFHGYGHEVWCSRNNNTATNMFFVPIPKTGLTKLAFLCLLLFENLKWTPLDPNSDEWKREIEANKTWKYSNTSQRPPIPALPEMRITNDLWVHAEVDKYLKNKLTNNNYNTSLIPTIFNYYTSKKWTKFIVIRDPLCRLVSVFLEKCVRDIRHWCHLEDNEMKQFGLDKWNFEYKKMEKEMLFQLWELFVYKLYVLMTDNIKWAYINNHFDLQVRFDYIYHFIDYFDYIIVYNKDNFGQNVHQLLKQLKNEGSLWHKIPYYWEGWGHHQNETLFRKYTVHASTASDNAEQELMKKYYRKNETIKMALTMYKYDYMLLPLEYPPKWLKEML